MTETRLNEINFRKGFLLDSEFMAGITETQAAGENAAGNASSFSAFIVNHETGEYVAFQEFTAVSEALSWLYSHPRPWQFEFTSVCGGCNKQVENGGACPGGVCSKADPSKPASFVEQI